MGKNNKSKLLSGNGHPQKPVVRARDRVVVVVVVGLDDVFNAYDGLTLDVVAAVSIDASYAHILVQGTLTYFVRGSIAVWLTSCLTG